MGDPMFLETLTDNQILLGWAILFAFLLVPRFLSMWGCRPSTRRDASSSIPVRPDTSAVLDRKMDRQTGPKWEQDKPFPECFEQEDDL